MILDGFPQINVLGAAVAPTFGTFKRSAGVPLPWERIALDAIAAIRSRFLDKNTSMTCPFWSTAR